MTPRWRQTPLERCAAVARAFEASQIALWNSMWPLGHCAVSSLLLAPLLRCADEPGGWRVAVGEVAHTLPHGQRYDWARRQPLVHAWCESAAGDIVDATYGQFDHMEPLLVLPAYRAGDLGHYTSWRMTLDEEEDARRSISPELSPKGWGAHSNVKAYFDLLRRPHDW